MRSKLNIRLCFSFRFFSECRRLISTIEFSNVFQLVLNDLIKEHNALHDKKIIRSLQLDVRSRWNSTHYMLESLMIFRPIIENLFKNIRKLNISKRQMNSLSQLEISNDYWDLIEILMKVLAPFRHETKLISGSQYPTVGLTLFVLRKIQQNFLEANRSDDDDLLQGMKKILLDQINYYTIEGDYAEGFSNLLVSVMSNPISSTNGLLFQYFVKFYAYFDPFGLLVMTQKEITSVECQMKSSTRHLFTTDHNISTKTKNEKHTKMDLFLDSIDDDSHSTQKTSGNPSTPVFTNEAKKYRQLAAAFVSGDYEKNDILSFWRTNQHVLPVLSRLAKKYLATPATSVPSESAFSKSAYYGRKERAKIHGDNLAKTVFLKDKLFKKSV